MIKHHRKNRVIEREGVNAARAFFEKHGCVFIETGLENDYGKDAHVDLGDPTLVSSVCAGVQIKSGISYQRGSDYRIPLSAADFDYWSTSTVPMIGIVYDPSDGLLRWVNITQHLDGLDGSPGSFIPVSQNAVLTQASLRGDFTASVQNTIVGFRRHPLAQLCDPSPAVQYRGISDCFILGRVDPRLFVGLRYMLFRLHETVRFRAILALAHLTPHPDIFFTAKTSFPEHVTHSVRSHFQWSVDEIETFLTLVPSEEWERGGIGQNIYMLLDQDPGIDMKLELSSQTLLSRHENAALLAILLLVYRAGEDGANCLKQLLQKMPTIQNNMLIREISTTLDDFGSVSFW